ncbi:MAG: transglycosylase SLT domain-containing protein [Oligoflexales bacterium]
MIRKIFAIGILASSCSSISHFGSEPDSMFAPPGEVAAILEEPAETSDSKEEEKLLVCQDNLYLDYVEKEALKRKMEEEGSHGRRVSSRRMKRLENEARLEARSVVYGPVTEYVGGVPVEVTPLVQTWIDYFRTRGRTDFTRWLIRSESYKEVLVPLILNEGLPKEIFFLAMIESGFSNSAYSRAAATGTWQFMKGTARLYGLQVNYWVDERRDPIKSTVAAAEYLRDLYNRFGDWYLAIAAYNAGPGKIQRAIRRAKTRNYWEIAKTDYIRSETKNYVPKMLAALIISEHPRQFGFDIIADPQDKTPSDFVQLEKSVRLSDVATKLGVSVSQIRRWNPEIIRDVIPPKHLRADRSPYKLRLPSDYHELFEENFDKVPEIVIEDVQMHRVRSGETLGSIARRYGVRISEIMAINPALNPKRLKIGNSIAVPVPAIKTALTSREV